VGSALAVARSCEHVRVGDLHPLWRSGGAGGVDQGEQVIAVQGAPALVQVKARRRRGFQLRERKRFGHVRPQAHHVLQVRARARGQQRGRELLLAHDHARARVAQHVLDRLRRQRVVDRERGRAEVHRRTVRQRELRTVEHHQRDRVAAAHPQRLQPRRDAPHARGVLAPGQLLRAAGRTQCDLLRALGRGRLKDLAQRARRAQAGIDVRR